jgi:hypothetical protein
VAIIYFAICIITLNLRPNRHIALTLESLKIHDFRLISFKLFCEVVLFNPTGKTNSRYSLSIDKLASRTVLLHASNLRRCFCKHNKVGIAKSWLIRFLLFLDFNNLHIYIWSDKDWHQSIGKLKFQLMQIYQYMTMDKTASSQILLSGWWSDFIRPMLSYAISFLKSSWTVMSGTSNAASKKWTILR